MSNGSFEEALRRTNEALEPRLNELLAGEGRLCEAMQYAVLGGGKRFRPFLVLESAALFGVPRGDALNCAATIECLHCYSLVHDDLPAMDDDDVRRGHPSVHKKFGEATAILAGDALQSIAFEILAKPETHPDPNIRAELISDLAQAAGWSGMAGGQELDIGVEVDVEKMSAMKTGALIRFSVLSGAILGRAQDDDRLALARYGEKLGLAFQLSDDLIDTEKDSVAGKKTFVTLLGLAAARTKLELTTQEAVQALDHFGAPATSLREAAEFMLRRTE